MATDPHTGEFAASSGLDFKLLRLWRFEPDFRLLNPKTNKHFCLGPGRRVQRQAILLHREALQGCAEGLREEEPQEAQEVVTTANCGLQHNQSVARNC